MVPVSNRIVAILTYYTFGMFDVSQVLDDEDIVGEIGDEPSSPMYNPFNVEPGIVVYEL